MFAGGGESQIECLNTIQKFCKENFANWLKSV